MAQRIILLFSIIIVTYSIPAPHLTPCKKDDNVCQTKNANTLYKLSVAGIPELNVGRLDPMYQDHTVGDLGFLKYQLHNTTVEGFKDCDVVNTKTDLEKSKIKFHLVCPYFNMNGVYQISGQLLAVPIEGNGDFALKFKDYDINIDIDIKVVEGKDSKRYLSLTNFKADIELKGGMIADLKNLFNGQKELGETTLKYINDNSKPVATLLQGPVFNANFEKLLKNFNKYLKHIPFDQYLQQ